MHSFGLLVGHLVGDYVFQNDWQAANKTKSNLVCTVHCLWYTIAILAFTFWWMPWWGFVICFLAHWPVDRWRLAHWYMKINHQEAFATGPLAPWSIIVVDNTIHLVVLYIIGMLVN